MKQITDSTYKKIKEALEYMAGVFDNPIARRKMPGDLEDEARKACREAIYAMEFEESISDESGDCARGQAILDILAK